MYNLSEFLLKIYDREYSSGSTSSVDSITSIQNIEEVKSDNSDVLLSEQEDEALPLNSTAICFPQNTAMKNSIIDQRSESKRPPLFSPLSLDASDVEHTENAKPRRTNSMRRDPPKILVNRVPPAGIG